MDPDAWLAWIDSLSQLRFMRPWDNPDYEFEFIEFVGEWYRDLMAHPNGADR